MSRARIARITKSIDNSTLGFVSQGSSKRCETRAGGLVLACFDVGGAILKLGLHSVRAWSAFSSLGVAWLVCGCTGSIGNVGDQDGLGSARDPVVCKETPGPVLAPLHRLSRTEYERGLRQLVGDSLVDGAADQLRTLPSDEAEGEGDFSRMDHRLSSEHVGAHYRVADRIATQLSQDADATVAAFGDCARANPDEACLRSALPGFLRRAFHRDPTDDEIQNVIDEASSFSAGERIHAAVFLTLMAPDFLYRFENRGEEVSPEVVELTGFELASRLAAHFWSGPPDDALLDAAASGALDSEEGFREQVDRMVAHPRTEATVIGFFDEWFHLHRPPFGTSPRLEVLRDGTDMTGLSEAMRSEVHELLRFHLDQGDGFREALTSRYSFAQDPRLATIYGVEPWDGTSSPPMLPEGERSGILTRAGMLYTEDGSTNPFRRGAFLRRSILCDAVAPPPADLPPDALQRPPTEAGASSRDQFAAKIVEEPCASCHAQFTSLGYIMEAYDGLGRYRTEERLVTVEGNDEGTAAVDASAVAAIEGRDEPAVSGPVALSQAIADSPKANACFASRYVRFTYRREIVGEDQCVADRIARELEGGQSMREALRSVALDESFRLRRLEP